MKVGLIDVNQTIERRLWGTWFVCRRAAYGERERLVNSGFKQIFTWIVGGFCVEHIEFKLMFVFILDMQKRFEPFGCGFAVMCENFENGFVVFNDFHGIAFGQFSGEF